MSSAPSAPSHVLAGLLEDVSFEMTGKDIDGLTGARESLPRGSRINVTFLANEQQQQRLRAVRAVRDAGFVPVPHISARQLESRAELEEYLAAIREAGSCDEVFVVGGDPASPRGPYEDSLEVVRSGLLEQYGVRCVGIGGYPEGHPFISDAALWSALEDKSGTIRQRGLVGGIITQFGFDVDPVLSWAEAVRQRGIDLPIRVGVPGPAGIRRLLRYGARFSVGTSAGIAKKYGLSLTNLMGTAGPDRFLHDLARNYDAQRHGELKLHFYTFGGLKATSDWVTEFRRKEG
ncbi:MULTISPECIES: methylenetetrahydrofolate reductase [unclassified Actinopolyspora]|uniref:methylenetetrahydrofolate reductase n=1 Tax=unclassified Actinopolyspora TaxID=2639451 RepID=UPI001A9986F5|nr:MULTISPECIES: methylenetetrahydrofolate reductase [unclassified Actinopolyspora]